jgi:SPP1 gp7 family putative phage head morphogenesis protein
VTRARTIALVRSLTRARAGVRRRVIPRQLQPDAIRLEYAKAIGRLLDKAKDVVERRIFPKARRLVALNQRADAADDINDDFDDVGKDFFEDIMKPGNLRRIAQEVASRTSDHQRRELEKQVTAALGVNVFGAEPNLAKATTAFVQENVALIKSIPSKYFDEVEKTIARFTSEGRRWEDLAKELERRFEVSQSSARLVARDQVGKFHGSLAKERQTQLGITHYIWRTANDERVRDAHEALNGQRFAWDDPPTEGHPGEAVLCRCYPEPDFSGLLGEAPAAAPPASEPEQLPAEAPVETPAAPQAPREVMRQALVAGDPKDSAVAATQFAEQELGLKFKRAEVTGISSTNLDSARGLTYPDGRIVIDTKVMADAQAALIDPKNATPEQLQGLRTLVHELNHQASPQAFRDHVGLGLVLEEVTTEVAARRMVAELVGLDGPITSESYQSWIDFTVASVARAGELTDLKAYKLLEKAALESRRSTDVVTIDGPKGFAMHLAYRMFPRDREKREAFVREMERLSP